MQHMASDPPELFRQAADTVDELLMRVDEIVPKLCTEVLYGCHISDDCRDDPIQALLPPPHPAPPLSCSSVYMRSHDCHSGRSKSMAVVFWKSLPTPSSAASAAWGTRPTPRRWCQRHGWTILHSRVRRKVSPSRTTILRPHSRWRLPSMVARALTPCEIPLLPCTPLVPLTALPP